MEGRNQGGVCSWIIQILQTALFLAFISPMCLCSPISRFVLCLSVCWLSISLSQAQTPSPILQSTPEWEGPDAVESTSIPIEPESVYSPGLSLKPSNVLNSKPSSSAQRKAPSYIRAQSLDGRTDIDIQMQGEVEIRRGSLLIRADRIQARFTTCKRKPGPDWLPDWFMKADQISFDQDSNQGVASNGSLVFKGVPILYASSFSFPLNNERQSGFLPPTFALNNLGGVEMSLPYYWNIAPNRDMTITTTPMTQRGVLFSNEFRYLERKEPQIPFKGMARFDLMPVDELRSTSRWGVSYQHMGLPDAKTPLSFNFNINRVSDNNYWKDFTTNPADPLVQRSLNNTASLGWASGGFNTAVSVSKLQTLQGTDSSTAIAPSYDRLPQINANYVRQDLGGFDWTVNSELTRFTVDRDFYCSFYPSSAYCYQPNGSRLVVNNQLLTNKTQWAVIRRRWWCRLTVWTQGRYLSVRFQCLV
ncbi:MAG: LPS-assembly protein LptD [Betaproteobacteria bacterium]|nr:LPS-assembly protein LptD [Betaproteobacteria bacterium]